MTLAQWMQRMIPLLLAGVVTLSTGRARGEGEDALRDAIERELDLTRGRRTISDGLMAIERERASTEYAAGVLAHGGSESLRRLDAYRVSRDARERQVRRRTRALYKLARGGMLRLMFEDVDDADARRSIQASRITRGRTMRWLVEHDIRELGVHRQAEDRARTELLASTRELQSLSGLRMASALQASALQQAARALDPQLERAHRQRRRLVARHGRGGAAELLEIVKHEREALLRGGVELGPDLRSPTGKKIVGRFGDYDDPVLRVPLHRNGVELRARRSQHVLAFAPGHVVFIGALSGFEQVVVIDHGRGYLSLTGRLMDIPLEIGVTVAAGERIGRVAPKTVDDGLGRTVYFELRHGDRPIDPTPHLEAL